MPWLLRPVAKWTLRIFHLQGQCRCHGRPPARTCAVAMDEEMTVETHSEPRAQHTCLRLFVYFARNRRILIIGILQAERSWFSKAKPTIVTFNGAVRAIDLNKINQKRRKPAGRWMDLETGLNAAAYNFGHPTAGPVAIHQREECM